jgi:D-glycero-alpha-D-manno-heptose 1-phosphate guanylyltransferase
MKNVCIILAGGLGTRLREVVPDKPKCLAPIGKHSFLEIQLDSLSKRGINNFILSLGYLADQVAIEAKFLSKRFDIECIVEPKPLGTGGAISHVMASMGLVETLVTNGDTFLEGDLSAMYQPLALSDGELLRMGVVETNDRLRYGGVRVSDGAVVGFLEKGCHGAGYINAGLYRVSSSIFSGVERGFSFSLELDLFPKLLKSHSITYSRIGGDFIDIGVPKDYRKFCALYG